MNTTCSRANRQGKYVLQAERDIKKLSQKILTEIVECKRPEIQYFKTCQRCLWSRGGIQKMVLKTIHSKLSKHDKKLKKKRKEKRKGDQHA